VEANTKRTKGNLTMKAKDALFAWTPMHWDSSRLDETRGKVRIGPILHKGDIDWTDHPVEYALTGGADLYRMADVRANETVGDALHRIQCNGCSRRYQPTNCPQGFPRNR
jgi:hypothetical protein